MVYKNSRFSLFSVKSELLKLMSKVIFNNKNAVFYPTLKRSVDNYFKEQNLNKTGNWQLYLKTLILIPSAVVLYLVLLNVSVVTVIGIALSALLGFILACIGFNVMHDACHGAYSSKKWVNELLGLTLNALGGNAFIWKQKHNIVHHTYTNIDGIDDDIAKSPVIRQCHTQPWKPFHRIQHIYLPIIYSISSVSWVFVFDMIKIWPSAYSQYRTSENVFKGPYRILGKQSAICHILYHYSSFSRRLTKMVHWIYKYAYCNGSYACTGVSTGARSRRN